MPLWVPRCQACDTPILGTWSVKRGQEAPRGTEALHGKTVRCRLCGTEERIGAGTVWVPEDS